MEKITIDKKIVSYAVHKGEPEQVVEQETPSSFMHESLPRPETLFGATYKIKTPHSEHAIYVTINDYELDGVLHPYEMFINTKNMEHFQWVVALTRTVSAVWRKGGDATFIVDEFKAVADPKGGYFKRGKYVQSIVQEIGMVIEQHLRRTGVLVKDSDPHVEAYIAQKKEELGVGAATGEFPPNATVCRKCAEKAVVVMDGCATCLSCGDSKCG